MDNTIENKAKFFGLYFGQTVVHTGIGRAMKHLGKRVVLNYENADKFQSLVFSNQRAVELKPLSSISDEDAIRLFGLSKYNKIEITRHFSGKKCVGFDFRWIDDIINNADGYSYGSIGLSIPEITHKQAMLAISMGYYIGDGAEIDYGWVKIKESEVGNG